jgi:hypothetical protein
MSVVDADYQTELTNLQGHLNKGTAPNAYQMNRLCQLLRDAVTRMGGGSVGLDAQNDALAVEVAAVATAKAALVTEAARVATAKSNTVTNAAAVATAKAAMVTAMGLLDAWNTEGEVTADPAAAATAVAAAQASWATQNTALAGFATQWATDNTSLATFATNFATQNTALATFATDAAATMALVDAIEAALGTAPVLIANTAQDG